MTKSFSPRRQITISVLEAALGSLVVAAISVGGILVVDHFTLASVSTRVLAVEASYVDKEDVELRIKPIDTNILEIKNDLRDIRNKLIK